MYVLAATEPRGSGAAGVVGSCFSCFWCSAVSVLAFLCFCVFGVLGVLSVLLLSGRTPLYKRAYQGSERPLSTESLSNRATI